MTLVQYISFKIQKSPMGLPEKCQGVLNYDHSLKIDLRLKVNNRNRARCEILNYISPVLYLIS